MTTRIIVNDHYRYLRIRAAIAKDQLAAIRSMQWRYINMDVLLFWERECFYHQRLLDMSISFSEFIPSGFAMIFYNGDPGDETSEK